VAALAKVLAICAGTVGGAAACVATGIAPVPLGIEPQHSVEAKIERVSEGTAGEAAPAAIEYEPAPSPPAPQPQREPRPEPEPEPPAPAAETAEVGAVEYEPPPPEPAPAPPAAESSGSSSGNAAGEFGP
jgi:hypothetical protein